MKYIQRLLITLLIFIAAIEFNSITASANTGETADTKAVNIGICGTISTVKTEDIIIPIDRYFTVRFDSNGGSIVPDQFVRNGSKVVNPAEPNKDGFEFICWTLGYNEFDFDTIIDCNIELKAVWREIENDTDNEESTNFIINEPEDNNEHSFIENNNDRETVSNQENKLDNTEINEKRPLEEKPEESDNKNDTNIIITEPYSESNGSMLEDLTNIIFTILKGVKYIIKVWIISIIWIFIFILQLLLLLLLILLIWRYLEDRQKDDEQ